MSDSVFNVPPWDGQEREVSLIWRLTRDNTSAECRLWTHPVGGQVRVDVEGEFVRSSAGRDQLSLLELAAAWKTQFHERGWSHKETIAPGSN